MPIDTDQVSTDVGFLTSQPGWQNAEGRRDYIRGIAVKSLQEPELDPEHHAAVLNELWNRADDRNWLEQSADFVGRSGKEIVAGIPAAGGAAALAVSDAVGLTDSGSGTRLKRGLAGLADATVQRVKSLHPNDKQEQRDAALDALKKDLDGRHYPDGLEAWMAGQYDGGEHKPDAETQQWIDGLTFGLGRKAVEADHHGSADNAKVRDWLESDRNPARKNSDIPGEPGPRALLGDYLVTRDPSTWEAFKARVSETDTQHKTRLRRYVNEAQYRQVQRASTGGVVDSLTNRAVEMQTSPIDLAATVLPLLKGAKAFAAAKAGAKGSALLEAGKGVAIGTTQAAASTALQNPNASNAQIVEAAGMGAVGAGMMTGAMLGAGHVINRLTTPKVGEVPQSGKAAEPQPAPGNEGASDAEFEEVEPKPGAPIIPPAPKPATSYESGGVDYPRAAAPTVSEGGVPVQRVPAAEIVRRPDLMQFKRMDDTATGVNEKDRLDGKWDDLKGGILLLWEPADPKAHGLTGRQKFIVANGHHRSEFGERVGVPEYNAQIIREADGYSAGDARRLGAEINIADGKGTIHDQAKFIRNIAATHGADEALAAAGRIGARGRKAANIAISASDPVFDSFINDQISPEAAEAIARAAPGNEGAQRVGLRSTLAGKAVDHAANVVKAVLLNSPTETQLDLLGNDDSAMRAMDEQAARATEIERGLREQVTAAQSAARRPEVAKRMGVDVAEPEAVNRKIAELKAELGRWENWPSHPDLAARVRQPGLSLEAQTPEQLAAEQGAAARRAEMERLQNEPLLGGLQAEDTTPDMFDTTAGETPLLNQPEKPKGFTNTGLPERSGEGGFIQLPKELGDALNHGVDLIRRGITDFAQWSAAMIRRFGEAVRAYLHDVWAAALKTSQTGAVQLGGTVEKQAPDLESARGAATMPNAPESASKAKPLQEPFGGAAADYTAFTREDMKARATTIVDAVGSVEQMARLLASEDGVRSLGLHPALQEFVQAETLKRARAAVESTTNDVDRIRATQTLRQVKSLWDVTGTEAGQHLAGRRYAAEEMRAEEPAMAVDDAIEKQQKATIDNALPVEPVKDVIDKAAEDAATAATDRMAEAMDDEAFEQRLQPILQNLMPMRQPDAAQAIAALTETGDTWREQTINEAVAAVDQQYTRNTKDPARKGAIRTLMDNLKSILKSKVPRTGIKPKIKNIAEGVARVFLDAQTEKGLFAQAWTAARNALLERLTNEGSDHLAAELKSVLPESPTLWFDPAAAADLFKLAIARLQGLESPRLEGVLVNPDRMGQAVVRHLTEEAVNAGMESARDAAVQQQMLAAWRDWVDQARGRAMVKAHLDLLQRRARLLEQDGGDLSKLVNQLRSKIAPGLNWRDIFTRLKTTQREWELELYQRIRQHQALQGLSPSEAVQLTREMSKAWQRERRTVFNRELTKQLAKVNGVKPSAATKVQASAPRLLKLINLGAFDSATFRDAVAKEWGIRDLSSPEAKRLKDLAIAMQNAPEGLPRRKLAQQFIEGLQDLTKLTKLEILESFWTAAVLSGWRTHVDILFAVANGLEDVGLGSIVTAFRTGNFDVAWRATWKVLANLPQAVQEALHHVVTGDRSMMRNYDAEIQAAAEDGHKLMSNAGRQLMSGGYLAKVPGAFMEFIGRMLTAWDHINSTSTYEGAKMMAMARHPELYKAALEIGPREQANARAQARSELTGGAEPANHTERLQENARVKEILDAGVPTEIIAQATEIGRDAALQGDPTGLGWWLYHIVQKLNHSLDDPIKAMEKEPPTNASGRLVLAALRRASTVMKVATGTKFVRTAAHALNRTLSYVPGLGLARMAEGSMHGAKADILIAKQLLGTAVGLGLVMAIRGRKDDEEGIEGSWKTLTPQQRSQLYAQGKQPNSVWHRDSHGRVVSFNYLQWGLAGILGTAGAMEDQRRYHSSNSDLAILMNGLTSGAMAWSDKAQLQTLQTLFGDSPYSSANPAEGLATKLNRYAATTVGGLVPRIAKDVDALIAPELHGASREWWTVWAQQVPMLRETTSGARVDIFGEDIKLDRGPLSRVVLFGTDAEPYRALGRMNERDLWLPDPSTGVRKVKLADGTRRDMTPLEKDRYQRATGEGYKKFIKEHGKDILAMPQDGAKKYIQQYTKFIRDHAAYAAVHP